MSDIPNLVDKLLALEGDMTHLRNAGPFGLAVLVTVIPFVVGCADAALPPLAEASAELVIPAHFRAPIDRESAVTRASADSVRRDRRMDPLFNVDYPVNPDGSPNTNVAARITGTMETKLNDMSGGIYWQAILNSFYEGNRATHEGRYRIRKGGSELWSNTLSGAHGGFFGLFLPAEKHFASEQNGTVAETCDLDMMGASSHLAWYSAPGFGGFPSVEWGHASDNSSDTDASPTCAERPPAPVEPPPPPIGAGSPFCLGPLQWYLCWYIDYYDWYGSYLGRQWLYCEPLC